MLLKKSILSLLICLTATSVIAETSSNLPPMLLKNATCRFRKKDNLNYCLNKDNKKITAELRKYEDGIITRSIPVINGVIDGTVRSFAINGDKIYEKNYKKGILHGTSTTYHDNNVIKSTIPYVKGLKEGIAKHYYNDGTLHVQSTYVEDKLDGQMNTYTKTGEPLFQFITAQNSFIEGKCKYLDEKDTVKTQKIPEIFIDAVNNNCITLGTELSKKCCSLDKSDILTNCNKTWLKNNINELRNYIKSCQ
jgi:antitoxin component YwqK of YwqJK toxin-antitoxin module